MSQLCTRFVTCHCTFKLPHETLRKRHRNRATRRQEPARAALWAPGEPCYTPRPALCRVASLRACCPTCAAKTSSYAQNLRSGGDLSQPEEATSRSRGRPQICSSYCPSWLREVASSDVVWSTVATCHQHVLPCRATLAPPTTAAPRRLGLTSGPLARLLETSWVRGLDRFDGETEAVQMSTCRKWRPVSQFGTRFVTCHLTSVTATSAPRHRRLERSRNRPPEAPRATQNPWQAPGPACTRWCATPPHQRATCIAVHSYACRGSSLRTESRSAGHVSRLTSAIGRLAAPQYG